MSKRANLIFPFKRIQTGYMSIAFFCLAALLFCGRAEAQPVGEVHIAGNTWQELQWGMYGVDETIALDTVDNTVYLTWTYAPQPPLDYHRRSYYNSFNSQSGWAYAEPGCWMFPGVSNREFHTLMLKDNLGGLVDLEFGCESLDPNILTMRAWWVADSFRAEPLDTAAWPSELWPRRASSPGGMVSLLGYESSNNLLLFSNYQIEPYIFRGWQLVDTISAPSYCIATAPISERVAVCYSKPKNIHMHHYAYTMDRDFYLVTSPDGIEWDWQDKTDLTHFGNLNPLRPLDDGEVMIDHDNHVHVALTTWEVLVDSITPESIMVNPYMTHIWHWSEASDSFSLIAENWIHQPPSCDTCDFSGRWPVYGVQLAEDPTSGYLYAVFQKNGFEDCSDRTYGPPHPNGEIWVSVSTDGGLNWSQGTDITNTHTPDCRPWDCACEMQPCINELVNDTLHIAYILDRDAAITDYGEMFMTEAKLIYHQVPVHLIPSEPLIHQFSIYEGPERCRYVPGDLNNNGESNGSDVVFGVNYFKGFGPPPTVDCDCEGITRPFYGAGDVNGSCAFNGVDVTFYVNYLKGLQQRILFCPQCPPDEARHAYEWPLGAGSGIVASGERGSKHNKSCFQSER